ncbi:MAG: NAD-glutamate dehydrogenase domain-containing protein [bacterium]
MAQLQKAIAQLMESRQERPPPTPEPQGIAAVASGLRGRVPADQLPIAEAFTDALLAKLNATLDTVPDPRALAAMAAGAFAFFRDRGRAALAVRVFAPQAERDGWTTPMTVVESVLDDRPFIVETVTALLESAGGEIQLLLHPLLGVERDPEGRVTRLGAADDGPARESVLHVEVANLAATPELQQQLTERLRALLVITSDYATMRSRLADCAQRLRATPLPRPWNDERDAVAAWLEGLASQRFVFLGYREYDLRDRAGQRFAALRVDSGLGLLRDTERSRWLTPAVLPPERAQHIDTPPLLIVSKTAVHSPVHRDVPMDDITIKEIDAAGAVIGARRLLGLFTAKAYAEPASLTPLLQRRLDVILAREGAVEDSYDWREWAALFDSFPHEELLASRIDDVHDAMRAIATCEATAQPAVRMRPDAHNRGYFVLVILPRARFSTDLHARVTAVIARVFGGPILLEQLALDARPVVRLHYHCLSADGAPAPSVETLRAALGDLLRTWDDGLRDALAGSASHADAERLVARYARALPAAYKASTDAADAARDIRHCEELLSGGREPVDLLAGRAGAPLTLKMYLADTPLALSDFVPVLEHLGLRVLGQDIVEFSIADGRRIAIHAFALEPCGGGRLDLARVGGPVVDALQAIRAGVAADDRLNALVSRAALPWRTVAILRAYVDHAHQIGVGTRSTLIDALVGNPICATALIDWFASKFDPNASPFSPSQRLGGPVAAAERSALEALTAVPSLAHDRVLRALAGAVSATVRTNAYAVEADRPLAFKFDAARLPQLTAPRPVWETWVQGRDMQGIHLRSGAVARGGIRFSDRPDDFRAEILELMRTQVVKNAIIVPSGAKGGFVLTAPGGSAAADAARIAAAYEGFIGALLSLTDNRERGQIVPPRHVVRYDGDDPYLVVAADKGTAAFSDLANRIAGVRGFWLGDAFASGGSQGYDHKRLGITARGAWESARQHFRELGRDVDRDAVSVVGIGDMSGDVFGNGLLRSRHLRLLAAFDHRHIFLDPTPDSERAPAERARLFALPRSTWADYAPAALGAGGAVYDRSAKSIALTGEARRLLGLDEAAPSGETVVRAILRLPVDLLWNGGIGTYVKASHESHTDVADPSNDAVRIDATELRATVVVEGGNLGLTQAARVEYALGGGRINTDAIDNSGGVDCSDHEVNLKIALQPLVDAGSLSEDVRRQSLAAVAEAVCEMVLSHTRNQARALAYDQLRSRTQLTAFRDLCTILESEAGLDRQLAHLPTREALRLRRGVYLGLTRPELAVLLAHTKLDLRRRILLSPLLDEPELESTLLDYFPAAFVAQHATAVRRHALRRDIIALALTNDLIDTMGVTFLVRVVRDSGRDVLDVVRTWVAALHLADGNELRAALAAVHDRLSETAAQRGAFLLAEGLERATVWLVRTQPPTQPLAATLGELRLAVGELFDSWAGALPPPRRTAFDSEAAALAGLGIPDALAERLTAFAALDEILDIADLTRHANVPRESAAAAFLLVGPLLGFDWLRQALSSSLTGEDRWEARAAAGLIEDLRQTRRQIANDVLVRQQPGASIENALAAWADVYDEQIDAVARLIGDLKAAAQPPLPALLVVLHELGRLARATAG